MVLLWLLKVVAEVTSPMHFTALSLNPMGRMSMRFSWPFYVAVGVIGCVSFFLGRWLPTEFLQNLAGMPLLAALSAALFQLVRDQLKYEETLALQQDAQHFTISITSHMANVAFDKYVEFCEKYIFALQQGLTEMWARGPSTYYGELASRLADIRLSYRAWIVFDLDDNIMEFEQALRKIGGTSRIFENVSPGESRSKRLDEIYELFDKLLDLQQKGKERDAKLTAGSIMDKLQDLLGAKELAQLRMSLIKRAVKTLTTEAPG
jgi:hypothetical protein